MRSKSLIGTTLSNFKIQRLVARGGMADVYYGVDEKLHRPVAIKVVEAASRTKSVQASRFLQEARMMAGWRHENIIQIFYAGDETGLYYYVMEYIDGYDLASILSVYQEKNQLIPVKDVLRIGDAIASALDYAHSQKIIHRDVKPANVLVANSDGRVVLGDFGLALDLNDKTQGDVFGSPHYIAPEQARRSSDAVPQSDLYSLGVILYEMFTGATPFDDPAPASLALQHITENPPLPRSINPAISIQVEKVLLKALEKSPEDRYPSGKKLMAALHNAIKAAPEKSLPVNSTLPPLPVNAPTVQRSEVSLRTFTKRRDVISALEKQTTTRHPVIAEEQLGTTGTEKRRSGWFLVFALLLLALLAFIAFRSGMFDGRFSFQEPSTEMLLQTEPALQIPATDTPSPFPMDTSLPFTVTASSTTTPTVTATLTATKTQTSVPSMTPTATFTKPAPLTIFPTVITSTSTPNIVGHPMIAYYNENSFYLFNQGQASRSASGFVFERISKDGVVQQRFEGWYWEEYIKNISITPNRCLSLEIYLSPDPYLSPPECDKRTLSNLSLPMTSDNLFWTPDSSSELFRILWLNEEIARCEIEAGACSFYVP